MTKLNYFTHKYYQFPIDLAISATAQPIVPRQINLIGPRYINLHRHEMPKARCVTKGLKLIFPRLVRGIEN